MEIRPCDRLFKVLPPLTNHEFEVLKASITEHGLLQPILLLPHSCIIHGYHRSKIAPGKILMTNFTQRQNSKNR